MCQCIYVVLYIYYTCISVYMNTCEVYFKCSVKQVVVGMLWIVLSDDILKSIANSQYIKFIFPTLLGHTFTKENN